MITPFDSADWLEDEESVSLYLKTTEAFGDPALARHAQEVARRVRERISQPFDTAEKFRA